MISPPLISRFPVAKMGVLFRLPPVLIEELDRVADHRGVSRNELVISILESAVPAAISAVPPEPERAPPRQDEGGGKKVRGPMDKGVRVGDLALPVREQAPEGGDRGRLDKGVRVSDIDLPVGRPRQANPKQGKKR